MCFKRNQNHAEEKRNYSDDLITQAKFQEVEAKRHDAEAERAQAAIAKFEDFFSQLPKSAF